MGNQPFKRVTTQRMSKPFWTGYRDVEQFVTEPHPPRSLDTMARALRVLITAPVMLPLGAWVRYMDAKTFWQGRGFGRTTGYLLGEVVLGALRDLHQWAFSVRTHEVVRVTLKSIELFPPGSVSLIHAVEIDGVHRPSVHTVDTLKRDLELVLLPRDRLYAEARLTHGMTWKATIEVSGVAETRARHWETFTLWEQVCMRFNRTALRSWETT